MQLILTTLLICNVGGPGTAKQAQPVVDKFLRHLEKSGGWKGQSLRGIYATRTDTCTKLWSQHKPTMVVADPATYLAHRAAWKLSPVARMGRADALKYHLLVRAGSSKKLEELAGKTILTPLAHDPRFVARVLFGGKLKGASLKLERARRPLAAIRKVARGKADAALIDGAAYAYLGELKLPVELVSIFRSKGLPQLTLSVVGKGGKAESKRILRALPKLCQGAGAELCKTFGITSFAKASPGAYRRLEQRYGR